MREILPPYSRQDDIIAEALSRKAFVGVCFELMSQIACRIANLKTHQLKNLLYAIASDDMRFSEKSAATAFFSAASGRNTILWPLIIAEGEKSLAVIVSCE